MLTARCASVSRDAARVGRRAEVVACSPEFLRDLDRVVADRSERCRELFAAVIASWACLLRVVTPSAAKAAATSPPPLISEESGLSARVAPSSGRTKFSTICRCRKRCKVARMNITVRARLVGLLVATGCTSRPRAPAAVRARLSAAGPGSRAPHSRSAPPRRGAARRRSAC